MSNSSSFLFLPSSCTFCTRSIHHSFHFQCAECKDIYLCNDCFSAGVNIGNHENTHAYHIPDCLDYPMFAKDWTVKEELTLLDGIQKHGVGNWKTISELLKINKTTRQIEEHYWELFMGKHGYCLPSQCLMNGELMDIKSSYFPQAEVLIDANGNERISEDDYYHIPCNSLYQRGEPVQRDIVTMNDPYAVAMNAAAASTQQQQAKMKDRNEVLSRIQLLPGADLPGYMPLREDFDVEYENDAEVMLADMEFGFDDHPSEVELKLQVIRIYNIKLAERDRRKRFVIDRGLIDVKGQQAKEKKLSKEERELVGKLRIFSRFQTKEEFELLSESLLKARRLKQQLELYKLYQKMGLTTLQEIKQYEIDKKQQEKEMKYRKQRESASYLYEKASNASSNRQLSSVIEMDGDNEDTVSSNNDSNDPGKMNNKKRRGRTGGSIDLGSDKKAKASRATRSSATTPDNMNLNSTIAEDIERMRKAPHGELLNDLELELCVRVPLFPSYYLEAKRVILREATRTGMITSDGVKRILKLNPDQCSMIYDFFIKEMKSYEDGHK